MLKKDIEDIASKLEEAGSNTATQVERNKKKEGELAPLKSEQEELNIAHEGTLAALRMKHNNTMADLGEQIDSLSANKVKSEKDKVNTELDLRDARCDLEDAVKGKADLDKTGKLLQGNIVDANTRLDEMARALNKAESSKKRLLELGQVKQEIDRGVAEKEEEFNNTRKNHARAMESMSASLEAKQRAKGEALRVKKALEGEINELEIGLDHANKANSEGLKGVKRYQAQLKETIQLYEDKACSRSQIMEQVGISERKAAALSGELEESKALMDSSERSKRQLEIEIADGRNAVNNMQVINGRDVTAKRGLDVAIHTIQAEVDARLGAAKNAEEKSKGVVDAARLADELRVEQDHTNTQTKAKLKTKIKTQPKRESQEQPDHPTGKGPRLHP